MNVGMGDGWMKMMESCIALMLKNYINNQNNLFLVGILIIKKIIMIMIIILLECYKVKKSEKKNEKNKN